MRLTTKGRYAVTAMLDLALHGGNGPVSLADIYFDLALFSAFSTSFIFTATGTGPSSPP